MSIPLQWVACAEVPAPSALRGLFASPAQQQAAASVARIDEEMQHALDNINDPQVRQMFVLMAQKLDYCSDALIMQPLSETSLVELSMNGIAWQQATTLPLDQVVALRLHLGKQGEFLSAARVQRCESQTPRENGDLAARAYKIVAQLVATSTTARRRLGRFIVTQNNPDQPAAGSD